MAPRKFATIQAQRRDADRRKRDKTREDRQQSIEHMQATFRRASPSLMTPAYAAFRAQQQAKAEALRLLYAQEKAAHDARMAPKAAKLDAQVKGALARLEAQDEAKKAKARAIASRRLGK